MHWDAELNDGKGELTFGRPIRWLLFLYGGASCRSRSRGSAASSPRVQDVTTGAVTYGHRFLATSGRAGRAIKVRSFDEYRKNLAENFVMLARSDRRDRIVRDLEAQARRSADGPSCISTPGRGAAGRSPGSGRISRGGDRHLQPGFSRLPEEVLARRSSITSTFSRCPRRRRLMPAFLAVTNTQRQRPRHRDQRRARRRGAASRRAVFLGRRPGLARGPPGAARDLLFHKSLGSYARRANGSTPGAVDGRRRVRPPDARRGRTGGRLAKANLATDMVREFTELQGVMGGVYARESGEPETVWKAMYHHYLPVGVEPTAPPSYVGWAPPVRRGRPSPADKLDTLVGLFPRGRAAHRVSGSAGAAATGPRRAPDPPGLEALTGRPPAVHRRSWSMRPKTSPATPSDGGRHQRARRIPPRAPGFRVAAAWRVGPQCTRRHRAALDGGPAAGRFGAEPPRARGVLGNRVVPATGRGLQAGAQHRA